jgi:hypothetical protein
MDGTMVTSYDHAEGAANRDEDSLLDAGSETLITTVAAHDLEDGRSPWLVRIVWWWPRRNVMNVMNVESERCEARGEGKLTTADGE